ncbi:hypothetical protein A2U01_0097946, partial [Trifolium medium]|nr:hypothetical protein [Trifolium medium]
MCSLAPALARASDHCVPGISPKTAMASYIASSSSETKLVEAKATNSLGLSAAELEVLRSLLKNHKPSAPSQLHQFTT